MRYRWEVKLTDKITVTVNITGQLRDIYPHLEAQQVVETDQPVPVSVLILQLGINTKMVLFATINNRIAEKNYLVEQSCELNLVSPPAGG